MHAEVLAFLGRITGPRDTSKDKVLDIGSLNINGSTRPFFAAAQSYTGIDRRDGPGVDIVREAKDFQPDDEYTVVVCCEVLEHAENMDDVVACAWRSLVGGGLFISTAAGPDREPHDENGVPTTTAHYTAIDKRLLNKLLSEWEDVTVEYGASHGHAHGDIYAVATKPKRAKKTEAKEEGA